VCVSEEEVKQDKLTKVEITRTIQKEARNHASHRQYRHAVPILLGYLVLSKQPYINVVSVWPADIHGKVPVTYKASFVEWMVP
jgi:hypothetical protein